MANHGVDVVRWVDNVIDPTEGCRLSIRYRYKPASGAMRVDAFARLNMTSNARCGVYVGGR